MAVYVDKAKQLDLVEYIKSVLQTNSVLNSKFKDSNYLEYEPNLKSVSFKSLPYILIDVPEIDPNSFIDTRHAEVIKDFSVNITMVISYEARDKFRSYSNAILHSLDTNEASFEGYGYYDMEVGSVQPTVEIIQDKQVITGIITVSFSGVVQRL